MLLIPDNLRAAMQAPEIDVKAVLLSEAGVSEGKAQVLRNDSELRQALDAATSAEDQDDSGEGTDGQEAAAAVVS